MDEPCIFIILNVVRILPPFGYDPAALIKSIAGRSCMARTYNVIDADGHILEPFELWQEYTDPKYRDRAPRLRGGGRQAPADHRGPRARRPEPQLRQHRRHRRAPGHRCRDRDEI